MGRAKELYYEQLQQREDEHLATLLGITYDELLETDWHVETEKSKDDLIYGYVVYFGKDSPKHILDKIDGLNKDNEVWLSPGDFEDEEGEEDYAYEEQLSAIIANKTFYSSFKKEIANIKLLNELSIENPELQNVLRRQLFIATITTLETFLSECFINLTTENSDYFRNFIENHPKFKDHKFELREIYKEYGKLQETAKKEMVAVIYHNLAKVKNMFISTFRISFPEIAELSIAINTRHDLVHRNGRTKNGQDVIIQNKEIEELIDRVISFVEELSSSLGLNNRYRIWDLPF